MGAELCLAHDMGGWRHMGGPFCRHAALRLFHFCILSLPEKCVLWEVYFTFAPGKKLRPLKARYPHIISVSSLCLIVNYACHDSHNITTHVMKLPYLYYLQIFLLSWTGKYTHDTRMPDSHDIHQNWKPSERTLTIQVCYTIFS